jgi:signal transduction histidine kinase
MSAWRTIALRHLLITCGAMAIALATTAVAVRPAVRDTAARIVVASHGLAGRVLVEQCLRDPTTFAIEARDIRVYARDPRTLQSANPAAPPPAPALAERYGAGERNPVILFLPDPAGMGALLTEADSGPCGVLELRWPQPPGRRLAIALTAVGVFLLALGVGTAVSTAMLARPIARRLDELNAAADLVGTAAYTRVPRDTNEPLDRLADVLDGAHRRAVALREEEVARRALLEEHLDDVAHDLRTPLAALQLRIEAAARDAQGPLRAELHASMGDLTYLAELTANLRASRVLGSSHAREVGDTCDLSAIVARVVARFEVIGEHADVEVVGSCPEQSVLVGCETTLAERAVSNLVHNAVRHNSAGGHVSVLMTVADGRFRVAVSDDGPGVRPEQLTASGGGHSGGHLGLAIVRAVCARAGWSVALHNLEPTGFTAVLEGPAR